MHFIVRYKVLKNDIKNYMLGKTFTTGVLYSAIAKYSGVVVSILVGAYLARLLTPEEFGIVAFMIVFVNFFELLANFGLGPAIVQNHSLSEKDINSIFSFSIILGLIISGVFFFLVPLVANFYHREDLAIVAKLLSISVLLYSWQVVPKALLLKDLAFKQIGIITVIVQLVSGVIAISLAYMGFSYHALIFQSIVNGGFSLILFYWLRPVKLVFRVRLAAISKIIRFSVFQFLFDFINYFARNSDNILIGIFFNSTALGYYDKSYRMMMMPVANLTHVITPVLMPVLSKSQKNKDLVFNNYLKVVKLLATIGFPLSVFLYFSASELINIVYGSQWEQSIPVFKLLALTIGIQMVLSSSGSIFQVVNRTDLLFYTGLLNSLIMVGGILYGTLIGKSLVAVGQALIITFSISFFLAYYLLIKLALKKSFVTFLKSISLPILISIVIFLLLSAITSLKLLNPYLSLAINLFVSVSITIFYYSAHKLFSTH